MALILSPSQDDVQTALRTFLLAILPAGVEVIEAQDNRVPEPAVADFVVMTPIHRGRLATNLDGYADAAFIASIAADLMTVTSVDFGSIEIGRAVFGVNVAVGTVILSQVDGPSGGVGIYTVSPAQTVRSGLMAAGEKLATEEVELTYQLDVHGPNSANNAQTVSTLFRDGYAVDALAALNAAVSPLNADDPRQMPFVNEQQQYENRWVIDAVMQVNQTVSNIPQQFADQAHVGLIDVDAEYPA